MRRNRSRFWWAVGISLACHAALTSVVFVYSPTVCSSRASSSPAADVTLAAAPNYEPISVSIDDRPRIRATTILKTVNPPPKKQLPEQIAKPDVPAQTSSGSPINEPPSASPMASIIPSTSGAGGANAPTAIAPLHGPLKRAGLSVVYVLDRSGSMAQSNKLTHAVAVLKTSLRQLGPNVRFQIVTYDSRATVACLAGQMDLVPANPGTIAQAGCLLNALVGEGSSRHVEGLRAGLAMRPDLLILLSDAGDLSATEVNQIKQWNRQGTTIHAVLLGAANDVGAEALRELTGPGRLHFVALPALPALRP